MKLRKAAPPARDPLAAEKETMDANATRKLVHVNIVHISEWWMDIHVSNLPAPLTQEEWERFIRICCIMPVLVDLRIMHIGQVESSTPPYYVMRALHTPTYSVADDEMIRKGILSTFMQLQVPEILVQKNSRLLNTVRWFMENMGYEDIWMVTPQAVHGVKNGIAVTVTEALCPDNMLYVILTSAELDTRCGHFVSRKTIETDEKTDWIMEYAKERLTTAMTLLSLRRQGASVTTSTLTDIRALTKMFDMYIHTTVTPGDGGHKVRVDASKVRTRLKTSLTWDTLEAFLHDETWLQRCETGLKNAISHKANIRRMGQGLPTGK